MDRRSGSPTASSGGGPSTRAVKGRPLAQVSVLVVVGLTQFLVLIRGASTGKIVCVGAISSTTTILGVELRQGSRSANCGVLKLSGRNPYHDVPSASGRFPLERDAVAPNSTVSP